MPVAPSVQDLVDQGLAEAQFRRPDLLFAEGDVALAQIHAGAAMADACIRYAAQALAATFIDTAKGDDLTALVDDHLDLQRQPATADTVTVTFERTSGGAGETIAAGTVVATVIGADGREVRFTTDAPIVVPGAGNGPYDVGATCTEVGRDGNVAAAAISRIVDTLGDTTWTVTNVALAAGGNEEESDEQLRQRARTFWGTLRRGTLAALEFGALTVAAVRVAVASESANGLVTVVVADEDGNSNAQMIADTQVTLEAWRAAGVPVNVAGGTQLVQNIVAVLTTIEGFDLIAATSLIEEAVVSRGRKQRMGKVLYLDALTAAIIGVDPDGIEEVTFTTPTDDVTPTTYQVIRIGTVSLSEA